MAHPPWPAAARYVTAAIVVNFGGARDTEACVESVLAADPRPALVVIVDNASPDDSADRLARWLASRALRARVIDETMLSVGDRAWLAAGGDDPRLVLVRAAVNRGFGGGVNVGWRTARLDPRLGCVLLVNNDATVERNFLAPLLAAMRDPDVGVATGTIRHAPPRAGVWYAGGEFAWWQCRGRHITSPSSEPRDVTFCTGALMLVRAAAMEAVGGMPEPYFLYYEDVEFSLRVRRAGWRLRYVPGSVAHHSVGSAAGHRGASPRTAFVSARNRFWLARRNLPPVRRAVALGNVLMDEAGRALGALSRGSPEVAGAVVRGVAAGLFTAPDGASAERQAADLRRRFAGGAAGA